MKTIDISYLQQNLLDITSRIIKNNEGVRVRTPEGDAILLSKDDYSRLLEAQQIQLIDGLSPIWVKR